MENMRGSELQLGKDILMDGTKRWPYRLLGQDRHRIRQGIAVLLADSNILAAREIDGLIVEGHQFPDGDDIPAMDPAEKVAWQESFPLFEGAQDQDGRLVFQHQPGIVLLGLDVDDIVEIHLYIPAFTANKDKRLHSTVV